jgi:colanic acid biosynthesis glycosyl transferase WcaI
MSKKVILISYNYYPELTGIGKYNTEFCEYLAAKGYVVKVITAYPYYPNWKLQQGYKNNWFKKEIYNGVEILRCPFYIPHKPTGAKRMLLDLSFYLSSLICILLQIGKGSKFDFIVAISPSFFNGFNGLLLKTFNKKAKLIYHVQDLQIDAAIELGIIKNEFIIKLLLTLEKYIIINSNYVSTISIGMKKKLFAKYE